MRLRLIWRGSVLVALTAVAMVVVRYRCGLVYSFCLVLVMMRLSCGRFSCCSLLALLLKVNGVTSFLFRNRLGGGRARVSSRLGWVLSGVMRCWIGRILSV